MTASDQIDHAAASADGAIKGAEHRFQILAERLEKSVQEGLELLRTRGRDYADTAGESIDTAQRYVTERVQERPLTATVTALGVGLLIGLLLSNRDR
jgi:ElaB/YqjD/DUF883 family membrane-anchored ribosome-binding protein